jgi:hypothetical protein
LSRPKPAQLTTACLPWTSRSRVACMRSRDRRAASRLARRRGGGAARARARR